MRLDRPPYLRFVSFLLRLYGFESRVSGLHLWLIYCCFDFYIYPSLQICLRTADYSRGPGDA